MALSMREAIAAVSAPGQPFELTEGVLNGVDYRVFKNCPPTLRQFFESARGLEETFLVYEGEEWSFDEVMQEVDALAYALVHHYGIEVGDRVGIAMRNMPEWIVSFAAIVSVGAISVSLNAWWTEEELDYAISDSGLSLLIADPERIRRAQEICVQGDVRILGARLDELQPLRPEVESWTTVVTRGNAMPDVEIGPDHDATILYTSGTTGSPKGAVSTPGAICQTIMAFSAGAVINSSGRSADESSIGLAPCFILIVPLFHVTGCIPVMMSCFSWHFKLVMMYRWEAERALDLIERHKVTAFVGVPTQSWDLIECPNFSKYDTSSLASVGGGGAPAPPTLVARGEVVLPRAPLARLRHDRDQRVRPRELRRRLRPSSDVHRPRADHRDGRRDSRQPGPRARRRRARRDLAEVADPHPRLLAPGRGHGVDHRRRVDAHGRPRTHR